MKALPKNIHQVKKIPQVLHRKKQPTQAEASNSKQSDGHDHFNTIDTY